MKTNKEILLQWIDTTIESNYYINQDNLLSFLGDIEKPFVNLLEYKIRKQILEAYLENPKEETIFSVLSDIKSDYLLDGYSSVEFKALNRVLSKFNQPLFRG